MSVDRPARSLVLRCDLDGVVREVPRDDFRFPPAALVNRPFHAVLHRSNPGKGLALMDAVRREQTVRGWQLLIREPERACTLSFAAALADGEVLVAGSETAATCRAALEDAPWSSRNAAAKTRLQRRLRPLAAARQNGRCAYKKGNLAECSDLVHICDAPNLWV